MNVFFMYYLDIFHFYKYFFKNRAFQIFFYAFPPRAQILEFVYFLLDLLY